MKLNHEKVMSMCSNQHHFKEEVKSMFYFVLRDIVGIEDVIHYLQEAHGPYQSHEQMQCIIKYIHVHFNYRADKIIFNIP